jgi:hypothetical protein
MDGEMPSVSRPANGVIGTAWAFLLLFLASAIALGVVFGLKRFPYLTLPLCHTLPAILMLSAVLSAALAWSGEGDAPLAAVMPVAAFIIGGALFDIWATLVHSPDLKLEENPIARALLDSNHTLEFVYGYAALCQTLWLLTLCFLWVAFLRHRAGLIESVRGQRTVLSFLKAAHGGAALTYRQWLFPLTLEELPDPRPLVWIVAVAFLGLAVDRWWFGLEWYGLAPHALRYWAIGAGFVAALLVYFVWLWHASAVEPPPPLTGR